MFWCISNLFLSCCISVGLQVLVLWFNLPTIFTIIFLIFLCSNNNYWLAKPCTQNISLCLHLLHSYISTGLLTDNFMMILFYIGRTFPGHPYFMSQFGPGQLSLFNLLKAYSIHDTDVGYCQGLSFVAGILLMHMDESQAFDIMRHLMYDLNLRKLYKSDMQELQVPYQPVLLMKLALITCSIMLDLQYRTC